MHISDDMHEWRGRRRLVKAPIPDQLLANWFTKYLPPLSARDVSMGSVVMEEKAISHAQSLDLVYSQSGALYDSIPHAPRPTSDPLSPTTKPYVDGILGLVQTQTMRKLLRRKPNPLHQ